MKTIDLDEINELFGTKFLSTNKINWRELVKEFIIPEWFIKKYLRTLLYHTKSLLITTQDLSIDIIKEIYYEYSYLCDEENNKIINYYFWDNIIHCQQLGKEFILELLRDKVINLDDELVVSYQDNLPEELIEKFIKSNNTHNLSRYQNLSEKFIIDNLDKLDIDGLKENISISMDFKKEFLNFNLEEYKIETLNTLNSRKFFNNYFDYFDDYLIGYISNYNLITRTDLIDNKKKKLFYISKPVKKELSFGKIISDKTGFSIFSKKDIFTNKLSSIMVKIPYIIDNYCINEDLKDGCYFKKIIPLYKTAGNRVNYSI